MVELDESIRFKKGTKIYDLAYAINNGLELPVKESDWEDFDKFEIKEDDVTKPIFYYKNSKEGYKQSEIVNYVVDKWGKEYFASLQEKSSNLDPLDMDTLNKLFNYTEKSKILCAENEGPRGVNTINKLVKKQHIDTTKPSSIIGYYPGMLMMINKNNKALDLYNGDTGVLVTFKDDKTLYYMVKKSTNIIKEEGKVDDKIFKLGSFTFYPLRLIANNEIDMSVSAGGKVDMAVPLSPDEVIKKRHAIYRHLSQKDIVPFPGEDPREFWQRAEERTQNTARLYDELGMAEYQAIEVFVKLF